MLNVEKLNAFYGKKQVLFGIDLTLGDSRIAAVIAARMTSPLAESSCRRPSAHESQIPLPSLSPAATVAASSGAYARMDDWMRPAITRGLWIATGSSVLILLVGFVAIRHATKNKDPEGVA